MRDVLRIGGTALAVLLLMAGAVSPFITFGFQGAGWFVGFGSCAFIYSENVFAQSLSPAIQPGGFSWPFALLPMQISSTGAFGSSRLWAFPLWVPFLAIAIPTALLWHVYRSAPAPGICRCGYDLTGNTSGRCPECGRTVE